MGDLTPLRARCGRNSKRLQGVTLGLKPYYCIKFLDVTLKLKPVSSVLLPLELVSNFSKGRVLGMHFFSDIRPKRVHLGQFLGRRVEKLPLKLKPFRPGTHTEILAKVPHFSTDLVWKSKKKTQKKTTETGHRSMQERNLYEKHTVNHAKRP